MKKNTSNDKFGLMLGITAAIVLAIGLLWTARNIMDWPATRSKMDARREVRDQLLELRAEQDRARRQLAALNDLPRPVRPAPLAEAAAAPPAAARPEILDRGVKVLPDGWRLRRVELQYSEVALPDIGTMLDGLCARRPPWVLRGCEITASIRQDGFGRAILQMETLERE